MQRKSWILFYQAYRCHLPQKSGVLGTSLSNSSTVTSLSRVGEITPRPLPATQKMNYCQFSRVSNLLKGGADRVLKLIPDQVSALNNVWYQQLHGFKPVSALVPKKSFAARYHQVSEGAVHPSCTPESKSGMYPKTELDSSFPHIAQPQHFGDPISPIENLDAVKSREYLNCNLHSQMFSVESHFSSSTCNTGVNLPVRVISNSLCLHQLDMRSELSTHAQVPGELHCSGRRYFSTQSHVQLYASRNRHLQSVPPQALCCMGESDSWRKREAWGRPVVLTSQPARQNRLTPHGKSEDAHMKLLETDASWSLKLSNENGFLSWSRNTYLASALGLAMHTAGAGVVYADLSAFMIFVLAGLNLVWGTANYMYYLHSMATLARISKASRLLQMVFALTQVIIWFYACLIYVSSWEETVFDSEVDEA